MARAAICTAMDDPLRRGMELEQAQLADTMAVPARGEAIGLEDGDVDRGNGARRPVLPLADRIALLEAGR